MPVPDAIARVARAGDWRIPNERDCIRVAGAYISSAEALPQLRGDTCWSGLGRSLCSTSLTATKRLPYADRSQKMARSVPQWSGQCGSALTTDDVP